MKWMVHIVAGVLAVCGPFAAIAQGTEGGIRIEVVSAETRRPIDGVTITVTDRDGRAVEDRTRADGVVEIGGLDPGLYAITASGPEFVTASEPSVRVIARKVTPLALEMLAQEPVPASPIRTVPPAVPS